MPIDREIYFNSVRRSLFGGSLIQSQVDGQNYILDQAAIFIVQNAEKYGAGDLRHLAYCLATTYHETAKTMMPIEEYGKGQGMPYGKPDPETGQIYYGRGYVQMTWRDNYSRASKRLGLKGTDRDLEWHAECALIPSIAADSMFYGMEEGWYRSPHTLAKYFDEDTNDPYNAREIINGDKRRVPSWSNGVSIGDLIKSYHGRFLVALEAAYTPAELPVPEPEGEPTVISIQSPLGSKVIIIYNGEEVQL